MGGPSTGGLKSAVSQEQSLIPQFQQLSQDTTSLVPQLTSLAQQAETGIAQPYASGTNIVDSLVKHYSDIASGDNAALQSAVAPAVNAITTGTQAEKQQIAQDMPRSGARDLAIEQAGQSGVAQIGQVTNQAYQGSFGALGQLATQQLGISQQQLQDVLSAYGAATGTYQTAGGLLSGAAATGNSAISGQNDILQAQTAQKGAQMGLIGSIVGGGATIASAGIKPGTFGCWIAAAIYGDFTPEFYAARRYVFGMWQGRIADAVRSLYLRYGERVAAVVRREPWLKAAFKPLFDVAVRRGM